MLSSSVVHEAHETIELVTGDHYDGDQLCYRLQPEDAISRKGALAEHIALEPVL